MTQIEDVVNRATRIQGSGVPRKESEIQSALSDLNTSVAGLDAAIVTMVDMLESVLGPDIAQDPSDATLPDDLCKAGVEIRSIEQRINFMTRHLRSIISRVQL